MQQKNILTNFKEKAFALTIFLIAFSYRIVNLNTPFWVDEFSTASFSNLVLRYGFKIFQQSDYYFEYHNISTHFLVALFFKIFGASEFSARLPFVLIGSLIPVVIYFLSKKFFNKPTAVSASLLTCFSYLQITWSRQARGYVLQQLLVLTGIWLYLNLVNYLKNKTNNLKSILFFIGLLILLAFGIITHITYFLFILALGVHFIFFTPYAKKFLFKNKFFYLFLTITIALLSRTLLFNKIIISIFSLLKTGLANNIWYYHAFLWREYGLIIFLALIGFLLGIKEKKFVFSLLGIIIFNYLFFVCFIFRPYVSRYLLVIFPLFFILAAYSLSEISHLLITKLSLKKTLLVKLAKPILLSLFIIINGHKFTLLPKNYYSVDHDMREIALIDYDQVYQIIQNKIENNIEPIPIIETWTDRTTWYLNINYRPLYALRWEDDSKLINGMEIKTNFIFNQLGEKILPASGSDPIKLITNLEDLQKITNKYSKGFIFIDDSSLSKEIINYVQKHFQKEIYLDHYSLDDNPYSIWPATLYSWGF